MASKEIKDLIAKEIDQGFSREQIVSDLIFAGFSYQEIQGAFNEMAQEGKLPSDFIVSGRTTAKRTFHLPKINRIDQVIEAQEEEEEKINPIDLFLSRHKKTLIIILISLVILGVGGWFGFYFYSTSTSVVMSKTLTNFSKLKSGSFYLSANVDFNKANDNNQAIFKLFPEKLTLESKGFFDAQKGTTLSYSVQMSVKEGYDASDLAKSLWGIGAISTIDNSFYFKLNELATTTLDDKILADQLLSNWVLVDVLDKKPLLKFVPFQILSLLEKYQKFLSSDLTEVLSLINDYELIKSVNNLGSQKIGNASYYHYQVYLNEQKAQNIVLRLYSFIGTDSGWLSLLIKNPLEIWINKKTLLPYQIVIKNEFADDLLTLNPQKVTVVLSNLGKSYNISAPAQFLSLERVLQIIQNSNQ